MAQERKRPLGQARTWLAAVVLCLACVAMTAPAAIALPSGFWGVSPQAPPSVEQFQRLRAGGVNSVRIPISWAAIAAARQCGSELHGTRPARRRRRCGRPQRAALRLRRSVLGGALRLGFLISGATAPKTLPVKTGAQRSAWTNFLELVVQRYGPSGSFWAANPRLPAQPDPHLADLERGELQVLRRRDPTRSTTASWSTSPTRRSKASTPAPS